jgi:hypothetical protein
MIWIEQYAEALGVPLQQADRDRILELARDVAHGTERMYAPLASFLAGWFVGSGGSLDDAIARARQLLSEA